MNQEKYSLEWIEVSQGYSLLAIAIKVSGSVESFPTLLGVSVRNRQAGVIDLVPFEVNSPGIKICLIEYPEQLGDSGSINPLHYSGEITFALWPDNKYQYELARIPWRSWEYYNISSLDPYHKVDSYTVSNLENNFTAMRERYLGLPRWNAKRVNNG